MAANSRPSFCSDPERWKLDTQVTVPTAEHPFPSLMPVSTRDGVLSPAPGLHSSAPLQGPLCKASSGRRNNSASPFFWGVEVLPHKMGMLVLAYIGEKGAHPFLYRAEFLAASFFTSEKRNKIPLTHTTYPSLPLHKPCGAL